MERELVKKKLLFCRDIDGEIAYSQKQLKAYEDEYYSMGGAALGENFINSRNKVSKPTETLALNIPDSASAAMKELRGRIERLAALKAAILYELDKLTLLQKSILRDFYILGFQWERISAQISYSGTQCKKIRNHALDNLGKNFAQNAFVKNFNYPI